MHPEPLTQHDLERIEREAAERELAESALDLRITHALEQAPHVRIPDDFAARVTTRIPASTVRLRTARIQVRRVGYAVTAACLVALAIAMLALAPHTAHSSFYLALQWTLAAQFCLLAAWLAVPRRR